MYQDFNIYGEILQKMQIHLLETNFLKCRIWRTKKVFWGYVMCICLSVSNSSSEKRLV